MSAYDFLKRVEQARAKMPGEPSERALCVKAGLSPDFLRNIRTGKTRSPRSDNVQRLAAYLGVSTDWLLSGEDGAEMEPPPSPAQTSGGVVEVGGTEYALLPRFDIGVSAGPGALIEEDGEPLGHQPFEHQWLRGLTASPLDRLAILTVRGDSMWSTLHNGDHVLIDLTARQYQRDGLYVLDIGDGLQVKRVSMHPTSRRVTVSSDNDAYPTWSDLNPDELRWVGRVLWMGRRL